jgi:hypothetical protein
MYSTGLSTQNKTFIIDHPTNTNRYLVHACLEGPETGVYYRGQAEIQEGQNSATVILADYVKYLATNFTIQITPIYTGVKRTENYEVSKVVDGVFNVYGPPGEFFWHVYGMRGAIEVEPLKSSVEVKGSGPYKWI